MKVLDRSFVLVLVVAGSSSTAESQTLGPDFVDDYTIHAIPSVPGVPIRLGGMVFNAGDPNKLLIVGESEWPSAAIYEIEVTRGGNGHVNGFVAGSATVFLQTPYAGAGLGYGPGGVLFHTTYPTNTLVQFEPGSTVPDKVIDLTFLGVSPSTGGLSITPIGFPGAGSLKLTSYNPDLWYNADLAPDGAGTYDANNLELRANLNGIGPEAFLYVDSTYPAFANQSVLVSAWWSEFIGAYEIDARGDPIPSTLRFFLTCCNNDAHNSARDPLTGDFLFSQLNGSDEVLVIRRIGSPVGTNYCASTANSTTFAAEISATGFDSLSANQVLLRAAIVPEQPFIFFFGPNQVREPFGDGFLCVGGGITRIVPPGFAAGGVALRAVDLPTVGITVAGTQNFQCWFRDPAGGQALFNLSDGLSVTFQE